MNMITFRGQQAPPKRRRFGFSGAKRHWQKR